jgi:hypothetical protein
LMTAVPGVHKAAAVGWISLTESFGRAREGGESNI